MNGNREPVNESPAAAPARPDPVTVRVAVPADRLAIVALQCRSLRRLGRGYYSEREIESYLRHTPTLEDYLVADSTYYVAQAGRRLAGCGGWSVKAPAYSAMTPAPSGAPPRIAPKVRAMYVDPDFARRGIGRAVLAAIERAILDAGYEETDLDATLSGVPLYQRCGYAPTGETEVLLPDGARVRFITMHKRLAGARPGNQTPSR